MGCCPSNENADRQNLVGKTILHRNPVEVIAQDFIDREEQPQYNDNFILLNPTPKPAFLDSIANSTQTTIQSARKDEKREIKVDNFELYPLFERNASLFEESNTSIQDMSKTKIMQKEISRGSNFDKVNIGPEIFVSLKKGVISDYYQIGKKMGEGAYGSVFQVKQKTTGKERAMKILKKKFVIKEEEGNLFSEVSVLKTLDHPHIVKIHDLMQDDDNYYLIMEFVKGGELFERIQKLKHFKEKDAANLMSQILSAVTYCHSKNIVHRDLKPENILLDSKEVDASLKIIDFGTSRRMMDNGQKMTQKLGTPYYMAPEVLNRSYDEKCDVWSCGVILYIFLCGYPPFNGNTDAEISAKIKKGKFKFDDDDWKGISVEAKNLITNMLTVDANKRISAKDALEHPWITGKAQNVSVINQKALLNLSKFKSENQLKRAILALITLQITSIPQNSAILKTFKDIDKDGNGRITKEELIEVFSKKMPITELEINQILQNVDINNSGEIDYTEFVMATMDREELLCKENLRLAFKAFDLDGNGFITKEELMTVMGGIDLDDEKWNELIRECDINGDGQISPDEFYNLLTKIA